MIRIEYIYHGYVILLMIAVYFQVNSSFQNLLHHKSIKSIHNKISKLNMISQSTSERHCQFIKNIAKYPNPSTRIETLFKLLQLRGDIIMDPYQRNGMNPFLIPVAKLSKDIDGSEDSMLCFIRWPTQKDDMELQLVRTNLIGVTLESLGTDQYCKRILAELDFVSDIRVKEAINIAKSDGIVYNSGDYLSMIPSEKKSQSLTDDEKRIYLDKFLLTKVGAFTDCYERIAKDFIKKGSEVSALVTCERAVSVFYGYGHPMTFHAKLMEQLANRETEARDVARAAMFTPKWTLGKNLQEIQDIITLAGFSTVDVLGDMHAFRATDPRTKDIEEGMSPIQITLDQVGHLMDAVTLGKVPGGWDAVRNEISLRYKDSGYPEIAEFILS